MNPFTLVLPSFGLLFLGYLIFRTYTLLLDILAQIDEQLTMHWSVQYTQRVLAAIIALSLVFEIYVFFAALKLILAWRQ